MKINVLLSITAILTALIIGFTAGAGMAPARYQRLIPYTGTGSGVLVSGTVLNLHGHTQYQSTTDIVGKISAPGVWEVAN